MSDLPKTLDDAMLDLRFHHGPVMRYGDIQAVLSWSLRTGKPCLVLLPNTQRRIHHERVIPCIVPMDSAWMWDEHIGDPRHVAFNCHRFAETLGFAPNVDRCFKIAAIVRDQLGELVKMPPPPSDMKAKKAEMLVIDNLTGKETTREIEDHV